MKKKPLSNKLSSGHTHTHKNCGPNAVKGVQCVKKIEETDFQPLTHACNDLYSSVQKHNLHIHMTKTSTDSQTNTNTQSLHFQGKELYMLAHN